MNPKIISYIGIGANLSQPLQQAKAAIIALSQLSQSRLLAVSPLYCSKPLGPADQPDYINAVAKVETRLEAEALLDALQAIELSQGRERKEERWGPRTLDLDILLYGNHTIQTSRLTIPHYHMAEREFVLYPLADIAADLTLPDGSKLHTLLAQCPMNGWQQLDESSGHFCD